MGRNAFRFANATWSRRQFGTFSTIYSAGLFDYIASDRLVKLIRGLYTALRTGGMLIAPFKDAARYDTFDYHWVTSWHAFLQRTEDDYWQLLADAGIPRDTIHAERDESGVIIFFIVQK